MQRKAILVLGMHRSGTSAFTRMLNLLGCDLPQALMEGWEGNLKGHWESNAIRALNDDILASAGSEWDDWMEFNPQWYDSPAFDGFLKRAQDVLRDDYGTSPFFVLKDPRNCRLARFWFAVLEKAEVEPLVAIPLRNPLEVVQSLGRRNDTHPDMAMLAWLRHVLDAEHGSRGRRRVFTYYDELLDNWAGVADKVQRGLGITWPRFSKRAGREIEEFLDPADRHHVQSPQSVQSSPMLSTWVRDANAIFLKWAENGEDVTDHAMLDGILAQFNAAGPAFAGLSHDVMKQRVENRELHTLLQARDGELARMTGEIATLHVSQGDLAAYQAQIQQLVEERALAEADKARVEGELAEVYIRVHASEAALGDVSATAREQEAQLLHLKEAYQSLEVDKARVEGELAEVHIRAHASEAALIAAADKEKASVEVFAAHNDLLKEQVKQRDTTLAELNVARNKINATLQSAQQELEKLKERARDRQYELETAQNVLRQRDEEISQTLASLKQERERNATQEKEKRLAEEAAARAEARLKDANDWVFNLAGERKAVEVRAASVEAQLARTEIALKVANVRLASLEQRQKHDAEEKANLRKRNKELEEQTDNLRAEKDEAEERWTTSQSELVTLSQLLRQKEAEQQSASKQARSADQQNEVAMLSSRLQTKEAEADRFAHHAEWLQKVNTVITGYPIWWSAMPKRWRDKWQRGRLLRRGLFDADTYLARYPDVSTSGIDPLRHYIIHGINENRTFK